MNGCEVYRNIRYARAERLGPAELLPLTDCEQDAPRGPIPPQLPSRLEMVLGPQEPLSQSEDCQVLSIFTPSSRGKRPVMVWFHGGAFVTGGGELPWYDGGRMAGNEDVVVVSVTARLGALGYLVDEDHTGPSPATTDQMSALEWVRRNIEQFGGDAGNITVFGQSAGGFAIEVLLRWGLPGQITGAVIQSGFLETPDINRHRDAVLEHSRAFAGFLGTDPRSLPVTDILSAQSEFARRTGASSWLPLRPEDECRIDVPIVSGWTREDTLPFILMQRGLLQPADRQALAEEVRSRNHTDVIGGTRALLDEVLDSGARAWAYEFVWDVPNTRWGAPHCMELPFLLGSEEAWRAAPMFSGADPELFRRTSEQLSAAWASFARTRNPGDSWFDHRSDPLRVNYIGSGHTDSDRVLLRAIHDADSAKERSRI